MHVQMCLQAQINTVSSKYTVCVCECEYVCFKQIEMDFKHIPFNLQFMSVNAPVYVQYLHHWYKLLLVPI